MKMKQFVSLFIIFFLLIIQCLSALDGLKKDYVSPEKKEELLLMLRKIGFDNNIDEIKDEIKKHPDLSKMGFKILPSPSKGKKNISTIQTTNNNKENNISSNNNNNTPLPKKKKSLKISSPFELEKELYLFNYQLKLETEVKYENIKGQDYFSQHNSQLAFNERIIFSGQKFFTDESLFKTFLDISYRRDKDFNSRTFKFNDGYLFWHTHRYNIDLGIIAPELSLSLLASPLAGGSFTFKTGDFNLWAGVGNVKRAINDFYRLDAYTGGVSLKKTNTNLSFNVIHFNEVKDSLPPSSYLLPEKENTVFSFNGYKAFLNKRLLLKGDFYYSILDNKLEAEKKDSAWNFLLNYSNHKTDWLLNYKIFKKDFNSLGGIYLQPDTEQLNFHLKYKMNKQIETFFELDNREYNYSQEDPENVYHPKLTLNLSPFSKIFPLKINFFYGFTKRENKSKTLYKKYNQTGIDLSYIPLKYKFFDKWNFLYQIDDESDYNNQLEDCTRHTYLFKAQKKVLRNLDLSLHLEHFLEEWNNSILTNKKTAFSIQGNFYLNNLLNLISNFYISTYDAKNDIEDYDLLKFSLELNYKLSVWNKIKVSLDYNSYDYTGNKSENRDEFLTSLKWITKF